MRLLSARHNQVGRLSLKARFQEPNLDSPASAIGPAAAESDRQSVERRLLTVHKGRFAIVPRCLAGEEAAMRRGGRLTLNSLSVRCASRLCSEFCAEFGMRQGSGISTHKPTSSHLYSRCCPLVSASAASGAARPIEGLCS